MALGRIRGGVAAEVGAGRRQQGSPRSDGSTVSVSQRPKVLEPASVCKSQEDTPQNNSEKKVMLPTLDGDLLQIIFEKVADRNILSSLRKTCRRMYRYVKFPIKGTNYAFSDIQLMRSFDLFLKQTYQLNIDNQLLRSILKDLKKIESAFSVPNGEVFEYKQPSQEAVNNMDQKKHNLDYLLTIGEMTLKIWLSKEGSESNITGISIFHSKTCGHTLPIKKIVEYKNNNVIENEAGVQTCDCLTLSDGSTYQNWKYENGVYTCDCLTDANRNIFINWKYENGVYTCDRLTDANRNIFINWKYENGVQTCDLLTDAAGSTYQNWKRKNGVDICDLLTQANRSTFKNWTRKNGVEACDLLIDADGDTFKNWKRENGVETKTILTLSFFIGFIRRIKAYLKGQ